LLSKPPVRRNASVPQVPKIAATKAIRRVVSGRPRVAHAHAGRAMATNGIDRT
jgi:hypothetical protein